MPVSMPTCSGTNATAAGTDTPTRSVSAAADVAGSANARESAADATQIDRIAFKSIRMIVPQSLRDTASGQRTGFDVTWLGFRFDLCAFGPGFGIAARRPRQAEVLAQGAALVLRAEEAPPSQLGQYEFDEIVESAGQERRHQVEAVAAVAAEPFLHVVDDLRGRTAHHGLR